MHDEMSQLIEVVRQLRSENGCPWDRAQTHLSIRRCLIEEAGEFLDAVEAADVEGMREELGDLLLQVVLHAQMAAEAGHFDIQGVAGSEKEKLLRRHPHVFGQVRADDAAAALHSWEQSKLGEAGAQSRRQSVMDGVPRSLPALARAAKALHKAEKCGFAWPSEAAVLDKVDEELAEVKAALRSGDAAAARAELGDLLLAVTSLCRWHKIEAEEALQEATGTFMRRFRQVEAECSRLGRSPGELTGDELGRLWDRAKAE